MNAIRRYAFLAFSVGLLFSQIRGAAYAAEPADAVLFNGNIITVDAGDSIARAVAIKDGLILRVGTNAHVRPLVGPNTRVINLAGRTVTPGLIDAHTHLAGYGQIEL
jgi:hypothetical protein